MARRRRRPIEGHKRLHIADSFTDTTEGKDLFAMDYSGQVHASAICAKSQRQQRGDYFENKVKSKHRKALGDSSFGKFGDKSGYGGNGGESHGRQTLLPVAQSVTAVEQPPDRNDEDGPVIPTDDIGEFVTLLMDGMRSDGEQLAESAKHVVANTFSIVVRPLEAVARMAAPLWPQLPDVAPTPSRENIKRAHDLLDDALAFRMPNAFMGRSRNPPLPPDPPCLHLPPLVEAVEGDKAKRDGARRALNVDPPARTDLSLSHPRNNKRGKRLKPAKLGAVKLAMSPPQSRERASSSCGSPSSDGCIETVSIFSRSTSQKMEVRPQKEAGLPTSLSIVPRQGEVLAAAPASALSFGEEIKVSKVGEEGTPRERLESACVDDLGTRDEGKGLQDHEQEPRAYRCLDGTLIVLEEKRVVSVRPEGSLAAAVGTFEQGHGGEATWELEYGELESCCINVSVGRDSKHSVGDVVVEVITRPTRSGSNGDKETNRRTFCLANPSECLELLRSIQTRWLTACSSCGNGTPCISANTNAAPNPSMENASGESIPASSKAIKCSDAEAGSCREQTIPPPRLPSQLGDKEGMDRGNIVSPLAAPKSEDSRGKGGGGSVMQLDPVVKKEVRRGDMCQPSVEVQEEGMLSALESPAKVLRDCRLQHRHEMHERKFKEDLESKARTTRANLRWRRQERRRSVSQGANVRGRKLSPTKALLGVDSPRSISVATCTNRQRVSSVDNSVIVSAPLMVQSSAAVTMPPPPAYAGIVSVPASPLMYPTTLPGMCAVLPPPPPLPESRAILRSPPPPPPLPLPNAGTILRSLPPRPPLPLQNPGMISRKPPPPPPLPPPLQNPGMMSRNPPPPPSLPRMPGLFSSRSLDNSSSDSAFFGSPAAPKSCPDHDGSFFGGRQRETSVATPDALQTKRRTSKPLMNLHWDVLPPAKIDRTVWAKAASGGLQSESVDDAEIEELEKLFQKKSALVGAPGGSRRMALGTESADNLGGSGLKRGNDGSSEVGRRREKNAGWKPVSKVQLLDVSRGNNVAIGLKAFRKFRVSELASVVGDLDPQELLTAEDLEKLEVCLPTKAEVRTVLAYKGPVESLGSAESFFLALARTPRPSSKVSVMLFTRQFSSIAEGASARLETLRLACEEVTSSGRLARVLERVLIIGNLLNEGTYQGNARGFRLASLLKLSHTKSPTDKRTTVLHYIVRSVAAKELAPLTSTSAVIVTGNEEGNGNAKAAPPSSKESKNDLCVAENRENSAAAGDSLLCVRGVSSVVSEPVLAKPEAGLALKRCTSAPKFGCGGVMTARLEEMRHQNTSSLTVKCSTVRSGRGRSRPRLSRVDALDLEAELEHVRAASKVPVGDTLVDVRQARRGLKQVRDELELVLAEEEEYALDEERLRGVKGGEGTTGTSKSTLSVTGEVRMVDAGHNNGIGRKAFLDMTAVRVTTGSIGGRDGGGRRLGIQRLESFVEEAGERLSAIEAEASECVARCKGLVEFFGEGKDEAQSAHIFSTLVQFLEILTEAKKVEKIC